jgi:hypothetical protein
LQLTVFDQSLWAAIFVQDLILVCVLLFRRRVRRVPVFTTLISFDIVRTVMLFVIQHSGSRATYFYTYWVLALIDVLLQLGVLYRIASCVFRPAGRWASDTVSGLIFLVLGSVAGATTLTWIPKPAVVLPLQVVLLKGNFFSALLFSELSVGMLALSVRAGLSWKAHIARLMQGFVGYSLCTLALETARTYFGVTQGSRAFSNLSQIRIVVYGLCMAYWIVTLWKEEPPSKKLTGSMRLQVFAIRQAVAAKIEAQRTEAKP